MDVTVLSKLSSRTDVAQTPSKPTGAREGFAIAFLAQGADGAATRSADRKPEQGVAADVDPSETIIGPYQATGSNVPDDSTPLAQASARRSTVDPDLRSDMLAQTTVVPHQETRSRASPEVVSRFGGPTAVMRETASVPSDSVPPANPQTGRSAELVEAAGKGDTSQNPGNADATNGARVAADDSSGNIQNQMSAVPRNLPKDAVPGTESVQNLDGANGKKASDVRSLANSTEPTTRAAEKVASAVAISSIGPSSGSVPATNAPGADEPAEVSRTVGAAVSSARPNFTSDPTASAPLVSQAPDTAPHPTMTLLERHLGGHAVRIVPQQSEAAAAGKDIGTSLWTASDARSPMAAVTTSARAPLLQDIGFKLAQGFAGGGRNAVGGVLSGSVIGTEFNLVHPQGDIPQEVGWDVRANVTTFGPGAAITAARAELAGNVSRQIVEAMRNITGKSLEIALNPVELGRVRMILSPSDAGVTMNILADRPDTLDLMRRNIDDLSRSFAELGYDDISFSFGQNDQMTDDRSEHQPDLNHQAMMQTIVPDTPAFETRSTLHLAVAPDGIDMRF